MNYQQLFQMQKGLDSHIESNHGLEEEDLFERKILALLVELGELANETRCFKFWSLKPSSPQETVLEEFVDGIHFILSLGIECGFDGEKDFAVALEKAASVNGQFLSVYEAIGKFRSSRSLMDYKELIAAYLHLGEMLGFNSSHIEKAYIDKNEVNYKRQAEGY
ncbi:dUTP diphosphatase [Cytobacillus firmus]|uniref:dUTP diphosphatase n=1 Tax=Cytobacillus firmus TaxID=1399 RepID=UPI00077C8D23|nr:dUTP diphosphatase [Cytobacillus firmus]MBG9541655.1 dUTPase [Cytobacillus firmus]MBG9547537.1 dUTPase [Cytobacillus firmus]MBG9554915.1 dUTPase [Cytobacillus firmus]MBG9559337.1 dUTPase [Cytobacillus firmus]MBG9574753.1 dUTPase [Cytobacillus firmus]